jgi:hypothetical protein
MLPALPSHLTRRTFLTNAGRGVGALALASLLQPGVRAASAAATDRWPGILPKLHHRAKAKRVIWLTMAGGPSHLETLDPKPVLAAQHGQPMPESLTKGQQLAQLQGATLKCYGRNGGSRSLGNAAQKSASCFRCSARWWTRSRLCAR